MARMASCSTEHRPTSLRFQFASLGDDSLRCLRHAIGYHPLAKTALITAAVVGTILIAINQGNVLLNGEFPSALYWKIPLTFTVPYCVATWSALRMARVPADT